MEPTERPVSPCPEYWLQATHERTSWIPHPRALTAAAGEAVTALEGEIDCMAHALAGLRARRNALLPISLLPEILENIFMFLRDVWPMQEGDSGWFSITQVCSQWRSIAIHHAPFWTRLSTGLHEVGLWELFLKRAGRVALRDFFWRRRFPAGIDRYTPLTFLEFRDAMMGDLSLVRGIHIEDAISERWFWPDEDEEDGGHIVPSLLVEFLNTLAHPVQHLTDLVLLIPRDKGPALLADGTSDPIMTSPARILSHHTPNLERLVLRGFSFAWTAGGVLPYLRSLTLLPWKGQAERDLTHTFKDVAIALRQTPLLEELVLVRQVPIPPADLQEDPIILPRLRTLRLRGKLKSYLALWRLLRVHPDAHVSIVFHSIKHRNDFAEIGSRLTSHLEETNLTYDTLSLHTVEAPEGENGPVTDGWTGWDTRTLALDLYDGARKIRPRGSAYEQDAVWAAEGPFFHPGIHLQWFFSQDFHDFHRTWQQEFDAEADPDETKDELESIYAPMPQPTPISTSSFDPFRREPPPPPPPPRDLLDRAAHPILKRLLWPGVDMSRLRKLLLRTRGERRASSLSSARWTPFPWNARLLRPLLLRAKALENIEISVAQSKKEAVWSIAQALKPVDAVTPARALKTLSLRRASFLQHNTGVSQVTSFCDTLVQRVERGCALTALKLILCRTDGNPVVERLRELVAHVECDDHTLTRYADWVTPFPVSEGDDEEQVFEDDMYGVL
ncbi:unnamed protein product [Peniophora sp. CBMAI 1063]|nr:unnamed protein product [Peniophora sp. CBMAI 1063]